MQVRRRHLRRELPKPPRHLTSRGHDPELLQLLLRRQPQLTDHPGALARQAVKECA